MQCQDREELITMKVVWTGLETKMNNAKWVPEKTIRQL